MLNKKNFILIFMLLICILLLSIGSIEAAPKIELKVAHIFSTDVGVHKLFVKFKEIVEERSNNQIEVKIFPAGQLGNERVITEQIYLGAIDIGHSSGGGWATVAPPAAAINLPFLWKDIDHVERFFKEANGLDICNELLKPFRLVALTYTYNGTRSALLRKKPIYKLEDVKNIKLRLPELPSWVTAWRALGANPTTVPWGEVYTALQTGVVDACEVTPQYICSAALQEVTKYFSLTKHLVDWSIVAINKQKWEEIPDDLKAIIIEAMDEAGEYQRALGVTSESEYLNIMKEAGVEVNELNPGEAEKFANAVEVVFKEYEEEFNNFNIKDLFKTINIYR